MRSARSSSAMAIGLATCLACGLAAPLRAEHFDMKLSVSAGKVKQQGVQDQQPTKAARGAKRPVLHVKAGQLLQAHWRVDCTADVKVADVLIHFFVVREKAAGDLDVPELGRDSAVVEAAVTMDFDPKDHTSGRMPFRLRQPGAYLVRVETRGTSGKYLHEHLAALDVVVDAKDAAP